MEQSLGEIEEEEEQILEEGGRLTGSMVGCRRIAVTWAVGEAWERFSLERVAVIRRAFRIVGLSLPLDGSEDHELSIRGLANEYLAEGLRNWEVGGIGKGEGVGGFAEEEINPGDEDEGEDLGEEVDFHYE